MGGIFLIGGVLALGGMLFGMVSCIEGGATARLEAASLAKAVEVKDDDYATLERLREEGEAESAERQEQAVATIAAIRQAEAKAKFDAEAQAARADDAEAATDRALALVDELQCPPPPKPEDPCDLLCTLPELPVE